MDVPRYPETEAGHGVTIGSLLSRSRDCVERGGWLSASSGQTGISKRANLPYWIRQLLNFSGNEIGNGRTSFTLSAPGWLPENLNPNKANSYHLFPQSAERMREFFDPQLDSRFHGSKGSLGEG